MFANAFQSGFISIFYSVGSAPLSIWNKEVKNGHIRRVVDEEVKSLVLEIAGSNVATTYITCPQKPRVSLAIKLPFLVMIIKNMKKYFTFEIQILDDKDIRRRFRVSNFQSTTKVQPFCTTMPIGLSDGWNQVQFNLADFTKRAYGSTYMETVRVQIHANVRVRRIYFSDTLYSEDEMPNEFRLFLPTGASKTKAREKAKMEKKQPLVKDPIPSGAPPSPVESPAAAGPEEEDIPEETPSKDAKLGSISSKEVHIEKSPSQEVHPEKISIKEALSQEANLEKTPSKQDQLEKSASKIDQTEKTSSKEALPEKTPSKELQEEGGQKEDTAIAQESAEAAPVEGAGDAVTEEKTENAEEEKPAEESPTEEAKSAKPEEVSTDAPTEETKGETPAEEGVTEQPTAEETPVDAPPETAPPETPAE